MTRRLRSSHGPSVAFMSYRLYVEVTRARVWRSWTRSKSEESELVVVVLGGSTNPGYWSKGKGSVGQRLETEEVHKVQVGEER